MNCSIDKVLSIGDTAVLHNEVRRYLERTGTSPSCLSRWATGYDSAAACMMQREQVRMSTAAKFRTAMAEHPEGRARRTKGSGIKMSEEAPRAEYQKLKKEDIEWRRREVERSRADHVAACLAEERARYGHVPFSQKPIESMAI